MLVIHENRGLNDHIRDVARRLALEGYRAVAPDFLSLVGGTPTNEDARATRSASSTSASGNRTRWRCSRAGEIQPRRQGRRGRLLLGRRLRQPARGRRRRQARCRRRPITARRPDPSGSRRKVRSPLLIHHAGLDDGSNATASPGGPPRAAGKPVTYQGYDRRQSRLQQRHLGRALQQGRRRPRLERTLRFFKRHLGHKKKGRRIAPPALLVRSRSQRSRD